MSVLEKSPLQLGDRGLAINMDLAEALAALRILCD